MKALAAATIVIIVLAIASMGVVTFMFMRGFGTGGQQLTREQAISKCNSLCAQDEQKIYMLHGHPGVLDLPNEKDGVSFLKPTSFCQARFNVKGYGTVYCDQLTTCKVTDGDGDSGYLHCADNIQVQQGGGSGSGAGGGGAGGGGGTTTINGPLAQGVPLGEKIMSCDRASGTYIKFYTNNSNPIVGEKIKVWGIVCNGTTPVVNAKVYLSWDNNPLGDISYYEGFDELKPAPTNVFDGWDFSDNFNSNSIQVIGYLSPHAFRAYKDFDHTSPNGNTQTMYESFTPNGIIADEAQFRVISGQGPRIEIINGNPHLTLAGQASGATYVLSNGTKTIYVHFIFSGSGCMPGEVTGEGSSGYITMDSCHHLLLNGYQAKYPDIIASNIIYHNMTLPENNSENVFVIIPSGFFTPTRMEFRHFAGVNESFMLKKVYFELFVTGVGGHGGSSYEIDDFKLIKYKDLTTTNQFGMFNITIKTPYIAGEHNLTASTLESSISASGTLHVKAIPDIKISFDTNEDNGVLKITGNVTYLNETPVNNAAIWIFIDGNPYSNKKEITKYTFDNENEKIFTININSSYSGGYTGKYSENINDGVLELYGWSRWHGYTKGYLFFDKPQFIENVSLDIKLSPSDKSNHVFYVGLINENNTNYQELPTLSWYINKQGNYYGKEFYPPTPLPNFNNIPIDTFKKIWFSPIQLYGGTKDGEIATTAIFLGGYQRNSGTNEIFIDNLTITSVGKMYTNSNGNFELNVGSLEPGEHNITIISYDPNGAVTKVSKTITT